ncbi:ABC transporter ATP-binding protein [Halobacteriovorax sp. HLS]|uniref:ABC transporter ATP-binding protein n=1 Tax=Halobacteriovorax sp. HLS TaxID=2234000 RepID=UPI000FD7DC43|nr:ABC transporter ATP-binding protein [Halobacteriovorax sp. HLS]
MKSSIISISNLSKKFGELQVLDGLNLSIELGEIYGFLGPNGAGKSTTLKCIIGQLEYDSGNISVFDISPDSRKQFKALSVGVVPETQNLYENLSVYQNLELFCGLLSVDKQRIYEICEELFLMDKLKSKVKYLSKGLKQRVLLARSVLHRPELLFLDEPTSGLDPISAHKVHNYIRKLNATGTTIFLTTHFMEEVEELCTRVGFLKNGKIIEEGSVTDLLEKYNVDKIKKVFLRLLDDSYE